MNIVTPLPHESAGFDSLEIDGEQAHLTKNGKRVLSASIQDVTGLKWFKDWVAYIVGSQK